MTYLPPINSKVTDFNTINQYLMYMQKLADEANMPYVNVSLDVGAAINAFKFVWNFPVRFNNVVIHLGDFHFIKENFGVIGKLIAGSGFEDVVFQSGVCSTGSLNGVLAGSHYNRAWIVHASFSEALERLLFERFLEEKNFVIPTSFYHFEEDQISNCRDLIEHATELYAHYHAFKDDMRKGVFGKTAQFWVQLYLDLIECQRRAHLAVQENDFNSRYAAWKQFLPMYFALNKPNYARYASYYVGVLENIDVLYPGLKELLDNNGFSVQAQERYPLRTAIDQRGEQTFNRDAKTAGGIKSFANDSNSVLKWTLNRSEQANNTAELLHMANIQTPGDIYKSLRPSQILKSESFCTRIVTVLKEEYINPFDSDLEKNLLYNLSSGMPISEDISGEILNTLHEGETLYKKFVTERLVSKDVLFHDPIPRRTLKLFDASSKKLLLTKNGPVKTVEVNRDILGTLLALSAKTEKMIDFESALEYPLCSIPLSIPNADGTPRKTTKSKLMTVIGRNCRSVLAHPSESRPQKDNVSAYIIDLIASICSMVGLPGTYEDLTWKFLETLPKGYTRVDIVADTYQDKSIKATK